MGKRTRDSSNSGGDDDKCFDSQVRRGRPPGVMPFSRRIIELRQLRRWNQDELAEKAGWKVATISRAERWVRIKPDALQDIAQALDVAYLELVVPEFLEGDDPAEWLDQLKSADLAGDFLNARKVAEALVADLVRPGHPLRERACVQLAIICDHQQEWERGLEILDQFLESAAQVPAEDEQRETRTGGSAWARYQRGVIGRGYAEHLLARTGGVMTDRIRGLLDRASADLREIASQSIDGMAVAARHQLGVCLLCEGKYREALAQFSSCLAERQRAEPATETGASYRVAYEHRRLAVCHCRIAFDTPAGSAEWHQQRNLAARHFSDAQRLALAAAHERLLQELARDADAWGFTCDATSALAIVKGPRQNNLPD